MSEPIEFIGIGFLIAISLVLCAKWLARSRVGRYAAKRLESAAPGLMSDIEADMGQLHAQIAVATRRLEVSVEQMKAKTSKQLSEIGKSSEAIARLKAEHVDRTIALEALTLKERAMAEQARDTEATLSAKTATLQETERILALRKAELGELMTFIDARDKLAEAEKRHAAATQSLKTENGKLEEDLAQSRRECLRLQHDMLGMKKQVEATWAAERMANAMLRERINDVASEVVRVAHALEGLGSPIETMLAGKMTELDGTAVLVAEPRPGISHNGPAGDESKGMLAHRLRSLQVRATRVASSGGP
jgi:chromosome segregation ATPase